MITSTFQHLQGVGATIERRLWESGLTNWELAAASDLKLPELGEIAPHAQASIDALECGDYKFFGSLLHGSLVWRWLPEFTRILYLDIETTGLTRGHDIITLVSCYDGRNTIPFVRDAGDLPAEYGARDLNEFPDFANGYDLLVTYNGATFDVPFLFWVWPQLALPAVHLDLRTPFHKLGYKGGLKGIEKATGLGRDRELYEVDGYMAVLLWWAHEQGDPAALPTLVRYGMEDVLALEPLAALAYNRLSADAPFDVAQLPEPTRRRVDWEWSPELVEKLAGQSQQQRRW